MTPEVWTIGHSTRSVDVFLDCLTSFQIERLVDVRRFPHSRRNPVYNTDALRKALFGKGIRYEFLGDELGGFRTVQAESSNLGLAGSSFQSYADHLESVLFQRGVDKLVALCTEARIACMCSERQPKDCHRKILADYLVLARGFQVHHILDPGEAIQHKLTPTARLVEGHVRYAPRALAEFEARAER